MNEEFYKRVLSTIILIPISFFFIIKGSIFFNIFLILLFFATSYEWVKMIKKNNLLKFAGIIYLFCSFYTAFKFRENFDYYEFLLIIIICISTDLGGYVFGKTFKGPKLTKISPKKTYSGVLGSFILSLIAGSVFINFISFDDKIYNDDLSIFLLILFFSLISQLGDLIISYFKRKSKVKDTGKILPGHGGLLDRIDGMIFVFPTCYLLTIL